MTLGKERDRRSQQILAPPLNGGKQMEGMQYDPSGIAGETAARVLVGRGAGLAGLLACGPTIGLGSYDALFHLETVRCKISTVRSMDRHLVAIWRHHDTLASLYCLRDLARVGKAESLTMPSVRVAEA